MKQKLLTTITATCLTLFMGSAHSAGELFIYNWGNYTNPEMIEKFEAKHGIKVSWPKSSRAAPDTTSWCPAIT
jgi:spermidine/putrescine transport system substrate-binding protein